jgi:hypothetical protein
VAGQVVEYLVQGRTGEPIHLFAAGTGARQRLTRRPSSSHLRHALLA